MKFPSKITSYSESTLSKFPILLSELKKTNMGIWVLYETTGKHFDNIEEFLDTIDCLFALQKVRFNVEREVLFYVE